MTLLPKDDRDELLRRLSETTIVVTSERERRDRVKVILDDGLMLEGTPEQIKRHLESIDFRGDSVWYLSTSKGILKITEMESTHLRNAIQKKYEEWVVELRKIENPLTYVRAMALGIQNQTWLAMVDELVSRSR